MSTLKTCYRCKQKKPLNEFSRDCSRPDGLQYWCKSCKRAYKAENREHAAERDRAYYKANRESAIERSRAWRIANPERAAEAKRAWNKANPERRAASHARDRAKYPERYAARIAVHHAVRRGQLAPACDLPCSACGGPAEEYHHDNGYSPEHALDVMAVCRVCHVEREYRDRS